MIGYYRKAIIDLKSQINELSKDMSNHELLLHIQLSLLKGILNAERKITALKTERKSLIVKRIRRGLSRRSSQALKYRISALDRRITQYQWLRYLYRSFGDAIAFLYLDKWSIKPLLYDDSTAAVKQESGHLTAKQGLPAELGLILDAKRHKVPALLTDLTNSIRYGDVCLLGGSVPELLEVKSSHNRNRRTTRQLSRLANVQSYLKNDEGYNVRGAAFCQRVNIRTPERNYVDQLNLSIGEALKTGHAIARPEPGLHFLVQTPGAHLDYGEAFEHLISPVPFFLNEYKNKEWWMSYYPFTLTIRNPEHLYLFVKGDLFILVIVDVGELIKLAARRQLTLTPLDDPVMAFQIEGAPGYLKEPFLLKFSQHFFTRIALECLSLDWVLDITEDHIAQLEDLFARHDARMADPNDVRSSWDHLVVVPNPNGN